MYGLSLICITAIWQLSKLTRVNFGSVSKTDSIYILDSLQKYFRSLAAISQNYVDLSALLYVIIMRMHV